MLHDFKNILLIVKNFQNGMNKKTVNQECLSDLSAWPHDLFETIEDFEIKIDRVDMGNVCKAARYLFQLRSVFIDCGVCFQSYREVIEKLNIEFNKTMENKKFKDDIRFYPATDKFEKFKIILENGIYCIEKLNIYFDYIFIENKEFTKIILIIENFFDNMKNITFKLHGTNFSDPKEIQNCLSFIKLQLINCEQGCNTIIVFIQNIIRKLDLSECDNTPL